MGVPGLTAAAFGTTARAEGKVTARGAGAIPAQTRPAGAGSPRSADAAAGQALFLGRQPFQNGGPACGSCHGIATLCVSQGPAPGADLTREYSTLGPDALNALLAQPPFAPMDKLYKKGPLTPGERRELLAFLRQEAEAQPAAPAPVAAPPAPQQIAAGEALFDGRARLRNGGPACATCHAGPGIPFPFGGTMGPDLTREYSKLGPQGMAVALKTLYFPAMNPLFGKKPLTEAEQSDLAAFFESAAQEPAPPSPTVILLAASIVLVALFFLWAWLAVGRRRVRSVRQALLARAGAGKGNRP